MKETKEYLGTIGVFSGLLAISDVEEAETVALASEGELDSIIDDTLKPEAYGTNLALVFQLGDKNMNCEIYTKRDQNGNLIEIILKPTVED